MTWRLVTHAYKKLELVRLGAIGRVTFIIRDELSHSMMRTIDLEHCPAYTGVSITGSVEVDEAPSVRKRRRKRKNDRDFVYREGALTHQAIVDFRTYFPSQALEDFVALWQRWHLNGYRPGTRRQLDLAGFFSGESLLDFPNRARKLLEEKGELVDRGFEFASGFLVEIAPLDVLNELYARFVALGGQDSG